MVDCDELEKKKIIEYLRKTSVPQLAECLAMGELDLNKMVIHSVFELGQLITLTGEIPKDKLLGVAEPNPPSTFVNGELKYLVREQMEAMRGIEIDDGGHLEKIERYIEKMKTGQTLRIPDQRDRSFRFIVTAHSGRT